MGDGEGRFLVTLIKVFFLSEMPKDFNKKKKGWKFTRWCVMPDHLVKQFSTYKFIYKYIANSIHWEYFN